jgi:hypothetical protein
MQSDDDDDDVHNLYFSTRSLLTTRRVSIAEQVAARLL